MTELDLGANAARLPVFTTEAARRVAAAACDDDAAVLAALGVTP